MNRFFSALLCLALAAASAPAFTQASTTGKKAASTPSFGKGSAAPKATPSQVPTKGAVTAKEKAQQQQMGRCSDKARNSKLAPGTPEYRKTITDCLNG